MIREAKYDDIKEILKLEQEILVNSNEEKIRKEINSNLYHIYVYEKNGILAYMTLYDLYDALELHHIVVDEDYRQKGIASKLVNFIGKEFRKKKVFLEVSELNKNAITFYERNAFERISVRKNYYRGNIDAFIYERKC
jgi:ribosomal-protein-alanine N-acetyltransferase